MKREVCIAAFVLFSVFVLLTGCEGCSEDDLVGLAAEVAPCELFSGAFEAHCYQRKAVEKNDIEYCNRINVPGMDPLIGDNAKIMGAQDKCYALLAVQKGDPFLCKGEVLRYSFVSNIDSRICGQDVALNTRNIGDCNFIEGTAYPMFGDPVNRESCLTTVEQTLINKGCDGLPDTLDNPDTSLRNCAISLAYVNNDPETCTELLTGDAVTDCKNLLDDHTRLGSFD